MAKKMKFEKALERLEEILDLLEKGDHSLEEALKLFEEGTRLSKLCARQLADARKKVEILKHNDAGEPASEPFRLEAED